jgi:hypothetical protein
MSLSIDAIAAICHEANRTYSIQTMGDRSHDSWEHAPDYQRASAILGVRFIDDNPGVSSEAVH